MFNIEVRFLGGISPRQQRFFQSAAARWSQVITGDLPSVRVNGEVIDDVIIEAQGLRIDGRNGILGQAGPTVLRPRTLLPARGIMEFDTADLVRLEADGSLEAVIVHEMGHVLGLGTIWQQLGLLRGAGTVNPTFIGNNTIREFTTLIGASTPTAVPVENTGGTGTRDGHWRESVFGNELMTGFLNVGANPLSRLTLAALQDMGYQVSPELADSYTLPNSLMLAIMGIVAHNHEHRCRMCGLRNGWEPIVLSDDCLVEDLVEEKS